MDEIQKMEKELEQLKMQKFIDSVNEVIEKNKKELVGNCYSSRIFGRKQGLRNSYLVRILDVTLNTMNCINGNEPTEDDYKGLGSNDIAVVFESINCVIDKKHNTFSLYSGRTNASLYNFSKPKYQISNEVFERVLGIVRENVCDIEFAVDKNVPGFDISCCGGELGYERKLKVLEDKGFRFVDITNITTLSLLSSHPFVYGDKIMVTPESMSIIKDEISEKKKSLNDWLGIGYPDRVAIRIEDDINLLSGLLDKMCE